MAPVPDPAELLRHVPWVRSLARRLAPDPEVADDLAQDTWVAALRSPPAHAANLRGWLARILRNRAAESGRAAARRAAREREREAARERAGGAAAPSAETLVERAQTERAVVDAVLALDEPYRTTVLLRFFEGWPPRRIAHAQDVPVATVNARLLRALQQLRADLGRRFGEKRLALALLPLAQAATLSLAGAILVNTKLLAAGGVLALLAGLAFFGPWSDPPAPVDASAGRGAPAPAVATLPPPANAPAAHARTAAEPGPEAAAAATRSAPVEPAEAAVSLRGRLVGADGTPLPGRSVVLVRGGWGDRAPADAPRAVAAGDGSFVLEVRAAGRVEVEAAGMTTVLASVVNPAMPPRNALVVAAPAVRLAGRVVDAAGAPIAGADVRLALPENLRTRFPDVADTTTPVPADARTDERGAFALPAVPALADAQIVAAHAGHGSEGRAVPAQDDAGLELVLRRPAAVAGSVQGQVIDSNGVVVPEAWVALGSGATRTDDEGRFVLPAAERAQYLRAAKSGAIPATAERPAAGWPPFVLLQLGGAPLRIRGRVVDAAGAPVAGARVFVRDPTLFGRIDDGLAVAEGIAAGLGPRSGGRSRGGVNWPWTRSDEEGAFELEGLMDRAYDLRAIDEDTILFAEVAGVRAGSTGVVIAFGADAVHREVSGRVADRAGRPVADVSVKTMCDALELYGQTSHLNGKGSARTGADGTFRLTNVPREHVYLRLDGQAIVPLEFGRGERRGFTALTGGVENGFTITVQARRHVQVELADAAAADEVAAFAGEERQMIDVFHGYGRRTTETIEVQEGRTPVFVVPDVVTHLELRKAGKVVRREAVALADGVNRFRW